MGHHCCAPQRADKHMTTRFRRALWFALAVNATMLVIEVGAGLHAGSVSLLADAVDFFGDAANYAVSLAVFSLAPVWRSRTALWKGWSMGVFGVFILARTAWGVANGTTPDAHVMWVVAVAA